MFDFVTYRLTVLESFETAEDAEYAPPDLFGALYFDAPFDAGTEALLDLALDQYGVFGADPGAFSIELEDEGGYVVRDSSGDPFLFLERVRDEEPSAPAAEAGVGP